MFRFKCSACGEWHEGMPTFGTDAPLYLSAIPEQDREMRCALTSDTCTVDQKFFFVRGCLEIPVEGAMEPSSGASGSRSVGPASISSSAVSKCLIVHILGHSLGGSLLRYRSTQARRISKLASISGTTALDHLSN
jgi:hypothetical protein